MTVYTKSRKRIKKLNRNRGVTLVSLLIFVSLVCLAFLYLMQTNSLVQCSYRIREQKERLSHLEGENKKMQMEITSFSSPANLEEVVKTLGMVEVDKITYLNSKEKEVAAHKGEIRGY